MLILYTVKLTIINNITKSVFIFNKDFEYTITSNDDMLYDNYHILYPEVYVLDLFKQEIEDYCISNSIDANDVIIDEYEIATHTERAEVFFENPIDVNSFTLSPSVKCYVYPKEPPLPVPTLTGKAYDATTIIWSWEEEIEYGHYLIKEPVDFNEGTNNVNIVATLPIGAKHYIETSLEPDTAYSRRLVSYNDTQTSLPSSEVTVTTETVNPEVSLDNYFINRNQDWSITDNEREIIKENLTAFHSGVGDFSDLKVYKQMDTDFYEKFKAYFTVTGKYTQREKRYEQVGFNYKVCLEAKETIQEQEGEVTFKLDAYPWQEMYKSEYLWATMPVTVCAKVYATINVYKKTEATKKITKKIEWEETTIEIIEMPPIENPTTIIISIDLSSSMSQKSIDGKTRLKTAKEGAVSFIKGMQRRGFKEIQYVVTGFARTAHSINCGIDTLTSTTASDKAIRVIESMTSGEGANDDGYINGEKVGALTNWDTGLTHGRGVANYSGRFTFENSGLLFFTDGFANYDSDNGFKPGQQSIIDKIKKETLKTYDLISGKHLFAIFGALASESDSTARTPEDYNKDLRKAITDSGKCIGYREKSIHQTPGEIINAFNDAIEIFAPSEPIENVITTKHSKNITVKGSTEKIESKTINISSRPLQFTFSIHNTPVAYSDYTKRVELVGKVHDTLMDNESILSLLTAAKEASPEWNDGYNQNDEVLDADGNPVGDVFSNIYIKDTYFFGDEDDIPNINFDTEYDYGMMGSVNVYANIPNIVTPDHTDDVYVATNDSFVRISGNTPAIIYDGTRHGHAMVNAYSRPEETIFYRSDIPNILRNRANKNIRYNGPINSSYVTKKEVSLTHPTPNYMQIYDNGIDRDMVIKISQKWSSPILNYRFSLRDPDAFTPYHEILPDCNPESSDKNVIILTVYYAKNVEINSTSLNDNYFSIFDSNNPVQKPLEFKYGLNSTWNYGKKVYDCDGHWITQFVRFFARKMFKTQDYYDEIPRNGEDSMYGLVNGRYRENNLSGKQDLIVQVPQFNIPTTVLASHANTIRIYIKITEYYPDSALVAYKWNNELIEGSGFTQVNGDYVTFYSDSLTHKDIEYFETIASYETELIEMFNNKPLEVLQPLKKITSDIQSLLKYNYLNTSQWQNNCEIINKTIQVNPGGHIYGPSVTLDKGRYKVSFHGDGLNLADYTCMVNEKELLIKETRRTNNEISYIFDLYKEEVKIEFRIMNKILSPEPIYIKEYTVERLNGKYENYYLDVVTDNGDVLATRYPTEIVFDSNDEVIVPITYRGIVNATSKWSPRIHNGYYYINQHEKYLFSEFDVEANFDTTEETLFDETTVFVSFLINLRKKAGPLESYNIIKNTIADMLQDEDRLMWSHDKKGITLKPVIDGITYKHYEAQEWISPVILFKNPLTSANALTIGYTNTDGTSTGLSFQIRSFDLEEGSWTEWKDFTNGTRPNVVLSAGYQVKTTLSASEQHSEYSYDDYLCCFLDWEEHLDMNLSKNIETITDHITTGTASGNGIAISKIYDYNCSTGMRVEMFASDKRAAIQIAFSNNINDLVIENVIWQNPSNSNIDLGYKYYRFKINFPRNTKIYWVYTEVKTLQTKASLPYIHSIGMSGTHKPQDSTHSFSKLESFVIKKDGLPHLIVNKIGDCISSDIINKGFELSEIASINITPTSPDVYLLFNPDILKPNPDTRLLDTSIEAAVEEITVSALTVLPFITSDNNIIEIKGTPQQYSPIVVEDIYGNSFKRVYDVNDEMQLTETHIITKQENYIELKRTDFELNTMSVLINDEECDIENYVIVNHLVLFKKHFNIDDTIKVIYNVENSFYANIDRKNNTTTITMYTNASTNSIPDNKFKVIFETNKNNNKLIANNLSLNPVYRTDYSGFIYLTEETNVPYSINIWCNPLRIKAGGLESVDIQVEVLDIIGNPVIDKTVYIDCNNGTLNKTKYDTDMNGVVHCIYHSPFFASVDTITARVLVEDDSTIQKTIKVVSY